MIKRLYSQISVIAGIVFLIGIYQYISQTREINLPSYIRQIGIFNLVIASVFYLLSHLVRGLRIAVMAGREDISLRKIIRTQFFTNSVNLILPFKLGEIYRLYEFHKIIKKYEVSVSSIIAEKSIDFCFLFMALLSSYYFAGPLHLDLSYTIIICSVFLVLILFGYFILPENIKSFNLFIAKRYSHPNWIKLLGFTSKIYTIIRNIKQILNDKTATLFVFTSIIWFLEILAFIFLMKFLPDIKLLPLLAFLVFLSIFIPSGSLGIGGVQLAFYCIYIIDPKFPFLELSLIYQIFLFLPAILISTLILIVEKYPEVKSVWKNTSRTNTVSLGNDSDKLDLNVEEIGIMTRIQEVYRYFKMKANL
jgi:hypothetical protein